MRTVNRIAILSVFLTAVSTLSSAGSILFRGGTVVAFNKQTQGLQVIRNGSVLVTNDRIARVFESAPAKTPLGAEIVNMTGKILTPGFIDTHRHGWQTVFKTMASNTTLIEFFGRYSSFVAPFFWNATDVYDSQLAGLYEAINAGVTTSLDHATHTWSKDAAEAGLQACIDSGARVFWGFTFANITGLITVEQLYPVFRAMAKKPGLKDSPTTLGIAYDGWGPNPNVGEINNIMALARELNVSVITTHSLQGPWGFNNSPEDIHALNYLNISIPIVFSHASFLTPTGADLLRSTNQYISITPESEMHYGQTHPVSYSIQDQASLGVDTHITFSTDILTQARIWLQQARYERYLDVLEENKLPRSNPMSAEQAFLLATRHGGLALRRNDLGIIAEGAKADLVVWDGTSPALLGWVDPVAAVILHASVGDIDGVLVDGKWAKRGGKLVAKGWPQARARFVQTAQRLQGVWRSLPLPEPPAEFNGRQVVDPVQADVLRGLGNGYGNIHI
ncbi:amidohydrolase family protein [Staphylotrichum tortipilum]|uniref:Amidohydrolase family protein n=1 Tax=Staphylotrichum tortipilum TaxID=2831512 RepID=A0AAN6RSU2_9PEZI|nr:amidohydrolase family protein [Staphylotrichum longicolle]